MDAKPFWDFVSSISFGTVVAWVLGIFNHIIIKFVYTALDGLYQSTATNNNIKVHGVALSFNLFKNFFFAIVELIHDERISAKFFERMVERGVHQQLLVLKDSHLGRNHSRINS